MDDGDFCMASATARIAMLLTHQGQATKVELPAGRKQSRAEIRTGPSEATSRTPEPHTAAGPCSRGRGLGPRN